jgi:hypothetical protein
VAAEQALPSFSAHYYSLASGSVELVVESVTPTTQRSRRSAKMLTVTKWNYARRGLEVGIADLTQHRVRMPWVVGVAAMSRLVQKLPISRLCQRCPAMRSSTRSRQESTARHFQESTVQPQDCKHHHWLPQFLKVQDNGVVAMLVE